MNEEQPFRIHSWYGLPAEISVGRVWHWVKASGVTMLHPGLVDLHLRRGLPRQTGAQLNYWHELGHLETLPLALLHALALWLTGRRRQDTPWTLRLLIGLLAWLAGWELAAEFYTLGRAGPEYARLYRKAHPLLPLALFFWLGMGLLAVVGSLWMLGGRLTAHPAPSTHPSPQMHLQRF